MLVDFLIEGRIEYAFASRQNFDITSSALADVEDALEARGYSVSRRSNSVPEDRRRDGLRLMREHGYSLFLGFRQLSAHDLIRRRRDSSALREEEI